MPSSSTSFLGVLNEAIYGETLPKSTRSPTHHFLLQQGIIYSVMGLVGMTSPMVYNKALFFPEPFTDEETAIYRACGLLILTIGYFYIQGARSNSYHFAASSVFDRVTFVPLGLIALYFLGCPLQLCLAFGILDPILAVLTYRSLANDNGDSYVQIT